ncbi:MAG: hypothetical protein JWQ84_462 [Mucilaginibacter sp.]|nr:hypothetical protein [Mucilaginibacter sp.]
MFAYYKKQIRLFVTSVFVVLLLSNIAQNFLNLFINLKNYAQYEIKVLLVP